MPSSRSSGDAAAKGRRAASGGGRRPPRRTHRTSVQEDAETLAVLGYEPIGDTDPEAALTALRAEPGCFVLLIVENRPSGPLGLAFARRAARPVNRPIELSLWAADTVRPEVLSAIPIVDVARRPWRSNAPALPLRRHLESDTRGASHRREAAEARAAAP